MATTTFQKSVLTRFLSERELGDLINKYNSNCRRGKSRGETMSRPITDREMDIVRAYMENTDTPARQLAEELKMPHSRLEFLVSSICRRMVYQKI